MPNPESRTNAPEFSVSDLAFSLKRTLEETYGHVRVRGELSRVKIHTSGHMYTDLKDEGAVINAVCWKGTLGRLSVRPEEGLEVVCTGRISTYPARSNYQLIIESMELAGQGALLKMLEDRRKRLAAEGLFDAARKKPLPFLPRRIGVVTSPTGAVIRDIMHRIADRFPVPVLLWPVLVQGPGAADQIAAAIAGFDRLELSMRPDVLIVARGGGSLEDLMAFNEEAVVRAAAVCSIPLISAVGHETDTTLIDFAADLRAPTPTAAAEFALPERLALLGQVRDDGQRLVAAAGRLLSGNRRLLQAAAARLANPGRLLEIKTQKLDHAAHRLGSGFERGLARRRERARELGAMLRHPRNLLAEKRRILAYGAERLSALTPEILLRLPVRRVAEASRMLESLSFHAVLERGFAVVRDVDGRLVSDAAQAREGQDIEIEFRGKKTVSAVVGRSER